MARAPAPQRRNSARARGTAHGSQAQSATPLTRAPPAGEFHAMGSRHVSLGGMDVGVGTEHGDDEFTAEEARAPRVVRSRAQSYGLTLARACPQVESAFSTNRTMCICQLGISVLQMGVCAVKFHKAPLRASVNIGACVVALPLISAGLWALEHPEDEHAVSVMQVYQVSPACAGGASERRHLTRGATK